jgi:DNA-directed RNA polymerase subunit RPC12/RpoP
MSFGARRYPNAVTIGWLIAEEMRMGVHCHPCGRHVVLDPATLLLAHGLLVPSLERRFRCTRCGSRSTEARPEFPS